MTHRIGWNRWLAAALAVAVVTALAVVLGVAQVTTHHPSWRPASNYSPAASSDGATVTWGGDGLVHDYARIANGDLVEFVNNNVGGQPWNAYDLSVGAPGGGPIAADPVAEWSCCNGPTSPTDPYIHVYARTPAGDLVEYVNNNVGGHLWNAYDLSAAAGGGGPITGKPAVAYDYLDNTPHVYVDTPSGHVTEYVHDNVNGHVWNTYDLSVGAGGGGPIAGDVTAFESTTRDGFIHVYARTAGGDLVEYVDDGVGGHLWNAYDLSVGAGGGGSVGGSPVGLSLSTPCDAADNLIHVYVATPIGQLVEYVDDGVGGHLWNAYNLSVGAGGGGAVTGRPSLVFADCGDGLVHVYVNTPAGQLTEYVNDNVNGHPWNAYDLSAGAAGGASIIGDASSVEGPAPSKHEELISVFAWSPGGAGNDLMYYVNQPASGHPWSVTDLSAVTAAR